MKPITIYSLCGTVIGYLLGSLIVPDEVHGRTTVVCAFAVAFALCGAAIGGRIIRMTGWMMLLGAALGGLVAILVNGNGKAAIYGVPIGAVAGLVVSQAFQRGGRFDEK